MKRMLIKVYPDNSLVLVISNWSRGKILAGIPVGRAAGAIRVVAASVGMGSTVVVASSGSVRVWVAAVVGTEAKASEDSVRTKERPGSMESVVTAVEVIVTPGGVEVS